MASKGRYTVDDIIQELEVGGEFECESDDDFEGYLDEEVAENSSSDETPLEEESCMEVGGEAEEMQGIEEALHIPIYTQQPGMRADIGEGRPIDFFRLFISATMLQHIVASTNMFADQYHENHDLSPCSRVREWRKVPHTLAELLKFIAVILTMSLVHFPQIENHWSTSWPYATDAFSSVS